MSGWGTAFFEIGSFAIILLVLVSSILIRGVMRDRLRREFYLLTLLLIHPVLMNAVPLAFPPFPFLIGLCAFFLWKPISLWSTLRNKPADRGAFYLRPALKST